MSPRERIRRATDGSATPITNAIIVALVLTSSTFLVYVGKVNGDAYISIASAVIGALLVRQGVHAGSQASNDPPAEG